LSEIDAIEPRFEQALVEFKRAVSAPDTRNAPKSSRL
jgi:hypothetical protein